jgi:hypothetical protein
LWTAYHREYVVSKLKRYPLFCRKEKVLGFMRVISAAEEGEGGYLYIYISLYPLRGQFKAQPPISLLKSNTTATAVYIHYYTHLPHTHPHYLIYRKEN